MTALISEDLYDEFARKRNDLRGGSPLPSGWRARMAHVFVPVGPLDGDGPRILFVGRATRDYGADDVATFEAATRRDSEIVQEQVSPFWRFCRSVVRHVRRSHGLAEDPLAEAPFGWSNLAKIGDTDYNPNKSSLSAQGDLCAESLRREIATMKPHAVVITTGGFAQMEIFNPTFGAGGWTDTVETRGEPLAGVKWLQLRHKLCDEFGRPLIHTDHPQGMQRYAEAVAEEIARIIGHYTVSPMK